VSELIVATDYTPMPWQQPRAVNGIIAKLVRLANSIGDDAPELIVKVSPLDYAAMRGAGMKLQQAYAQNPNLRKLMKASIRVEKDHTGDPTIVGHEGCASESFDGLAELQLRQDMTVAARWRARGF
jgi:hypothetical protein